MNSKKLECPFNWIESSKLAKNFNESQELRIEICEEPVLSITTDITFVYARSMQNDFKTAEEKLLMIESIWNTLDKE